MDRVKDNSNLDSVITYVLLKKLCTPIVKSPAYLMGIVNASGKVIKRPATDEEKISFTILDEIVYWLKRNLGGKVSQLNKFIYTIVSGNNFYNKILVVGNIEQRAEIIRIKKDIQGLSEKYNLTGDDLFKILIKDEAEILNEVKE